MNDTNPLSVVALRPGLAALAEWIQPGKKVLDLGCGDGSLLRYLRESRNVFGYGVEIDDKNLLSCFYNGINVIQNDLESGLSSFESDSFDYVILSQTLQAMRHTEDIIQEMLRVGKQGIVSFPNFGYWRNRVQVALGQMPISKALPYHWYDTPNIHLCTLNDFEALCRRCNAHIIECRVMSNYRPVHIFPNLMGMLAFYRFERAK